MSFVEQIQGTWFENYQVNGTKYLKNSREISATILEELVQCAGEIYLSKIPDTVTAVQLAAVACLVGEIYVLRFKVNFAGQTRGFAYLQYTNPGLMNLAIQRLPHLFLLNGLGNIRVRQSNNSSQLVLRNVIDKTPQVVEEMLNTLVSFRAVNVRAVIANKFEYQIVFWSNEEAVQARRIIISNISVFGRSAMVTWDRPGKK